MNEAKGQQAQPAYGFAAAAARRSQRRMLLTQRIELYALVLGVLLAVPGVWSDRLFNAGLALPLGTVFLLTASAVGMFHWFKNPKTTTTRRAIFWTELSLSIIALAFFLGVLHF